MGLVFKTNGWGSGEIRGKQIAEKLGVPYDRGIDHDSIVVVVKAEVLDVKETLAYVKSLWYDVVDGYGIIEELMHHPEIKAIAIGKNSARFISNRVRNKIVIIPEHHCNFENVVREDRDVRIVGSVCYPGNLELDPREIYKALSTIGLEYRVMDNFTDRQSVVDFYKSIDIQLCFRFWRGIGQKEPPELKNPLKLENAGSFKIPTVAYPEPCFIDEFGKDTFVHALSLKGLVAGCNMLKTDKSFYANYAQRAYLKALEFHIDRIAPMYLSLD